MAKYRLLQPAFINNLLYEDGAEVTVDDAVVPGPHMVPLDATAKAAAKKAGHSEATYTGDPVDVVPQLPVDTQPSA